MINRFKFWLFKWLLNDICEKGECRECKFNREMTIGDWATTACFEEEVFIQARNVWGIG